MGCLYCGKEILAIRQLRDDDFCSATHRLLYHERLRKGLSRLMEPEPPPAGSAGFVLHLPPAQTHYRHRGIAAEFRAAGGHLHAPAPWRIRIVPVFGDSFEPGKPAAIHAPDEASCRPAWTAEPAVSRAVLPGTSAWVPSLGTTCRPAAAGARYLPGTAHPGNLQPVVLARMVGGSTPHLTPAFPTPAGLAMGLAAAVSPFPAPVDATHRTAAGAGWILPAARPKAGGFVGIAGILDGREEITLLDRRVRRKPTAAAHRPRLVPRAERRAATPPVPADAVPLSGQYLPLQVPGPVQGSCAAMLARPAWLGITDRRGPAIPYIASRLRGTAALPAGAGQLPGLIPEPLAGDLRPFPGDTSWLASAAGLPSLAAVRGLDGMPGTAGAMITVPADTLDGSRAPAQPGMVWAAFGRKPAAAFAGTFPAPDRTAVPVAPASQCISRPVDASAAVSTAARWMALAPAATVLPEPAVAAVAVPARLPAGAPAGIARVARSAGGTLAAAPARIVTAAPVAVPKLAAIEGPAAPLHGNLEPAGEVVRGEAFPHRSAGALPAAAPALPASAAAALLPCFALMPDTSGPPTAPYVTTFAPAVRRTAPAASVEDLADGPEWKPTLPALALAPPPAVAPAAAACRAPEGAPVGDARTGLLAAGMRRAGQRTDTALPELPAGLDAYREELAIRAPRAAGPCRTALPVAAAPAPAKPVALPVTPASGAAPAAGLPRLALEPTAPAMAEAAGAVSLEYYVERTTMLLAGETSRECLTAVTPPAFHMAPVLPALDELAMQVWRRTRHAKGTIAKMPQPGKLPHRRAFGMAQVKAIAAGIAAVAVLWTFGSLRDSEASQRLWFWQAIADRATVEITEDFHSGLQSWQSAGTGWASSWSRHADGYMQIGRLALFGPSLTRTDYRMEFLTEVERKSVGWVVRARDTDNYYALKLTVAGGGPRPAVSMVRYPVVGGKKGRRVEIPVPWHVDMGTPYRVAVDVSGTRFTASIEGQEVDSWTDDTLASGGVGFFNEAGEKARLYWMKLSSNDDILGRICAFVTGKNTEETGRASHAMRSPAPDPAGTYALRAGAARPALPGNNEIKENARCAYCREWTRSQSRRYPPGGCPGIPGMRSA